MSTDDDALDRSYAADRAAIPEGHPLADILTGYLDDSYQDLAGHPPLTGRWGSGAEQVVYDDGQWVRVSLVEVTKPSGEREDHHKVVFPPPAMIVLTDRGRVLLQWRHRFAPDTWGWELPGGVIDPGESPRDAVVRELAEETGYLVAPEAVHHLITFEPAPGMLACPHQVFTAQGYTARVDATEQDEGRPQWVPWDRVPQEIAAGRVTNAATLVGLTLARTQEGIPRGRGD